jgi:hypothetical protein
MSFGFTNAPASFQSLMNDVLACFICNFMLIFDDILINNKSWSGHLQHVRTVLQCLREHHLVVKKRKCSFSTTTVTHLSHIIFSQGVAMDVKKVESFQAWQQPCSVHGFLGLTGYYRKFIRSYNDIAALLTQLLEKEAFCWTPVAFQALRMVMTTAPMLQQLDFSKAFTMHCNALRSGFGSSCTKAVNRLLSSAT